MIIYPIIIIGILLVLFTIVWRRAYFVGVNGMPSENKLHIDTEHLLSLLKRKKQEDDIEIEIQDNTDPSLKKAEELFRKKQYISAEKWYLEAIKTDPRNDKIYSRLGIIYINQKNYSDARDALEESVKINPSIASRHFNVSFVYNAQGEKKEAMNSAKKALKLDPNNRKYRQWADELKSKPF